MYVSAVLWNLRAKPVPDQAAIACTMHSCSMLPAIPTGQMSQLCSTVHSQTSFGVASLLVAEALSVHPFVLGGAASRLIKLCMCALTNFTAGGTRRDQHDAATSIRLGSSQSAAFRHASSCETYGPPPRASAGSCNKPDAVRRALKAESDRVPIGCGDRARLCFKHCF